MTQKRKQCRNKNTWKKETKTLDKKNLWDTLIVHLRYFKCLH